MTFFEQNKIPFILYCTKKQNKKQQKKTTTTTTHKCIYNCGQHIIVLYVSAIGQHSAIGNHLEKTYAQERGKVVIMDSKILPFELGLLLLHQMQLFSYILRVLAHRKYRRPRSRPHLIDHIFGARITLILLFASLFY